MRDVYKEGQFMDIREFDTKGVSFCHEKCIFEDLTNQMATKTFTFL